MATAAVGLSRAVYPETTLSFREAEVERMRITQIDGCRLCKKFRFADDLEHLMRRPDPLPGRARRRNQGAPVEPGEEGSTGAGADR